MKWITLISWIGFLLLLGAQGFCADNLLVDESFDHARRLLDRGEKREAVDLLKKSVANNRKSGPLARLLAAAYIADGNELWALKTLQRHATSTADPETLTWIAWTYLQNGKLDEAQEALETAGENVPDPAGCRIHLLRAMLYRAREQDRRARAELEWARKGSRMFAEDGSLMSHLENALDPGRIPPLSFSASLGVGWESNVTQNSILEGSERPSYVVELDHDGRLVVPTHRMLRPALEYRIKFMGFPGVKEIHGKDEAWDLSYVDFSGRAGVILGKAFPRLGLYYSNANLVPAGDDEYNSGRRAYAETHRGEFELDISDGVLVFGGAGRKIFREEPRSRNEGDLGLAVMKSLTDRISLTGILAGRLYDARAEAYDLRGSTGLIFVRTSFHEYGFGRLGCTLSFDDYHASGSSDYWGGKRRQDWMMRVKGALWTPSRRGFRVGLSYQYTKRDSTVDEFTFEDHEVLVKIFWRGEFDPWRPERIRPHLHADIDYGMGRALLPEERIRDLLRQEDAARRSQQCIE